MGYKKSFAPGSLIKSSEHNTNFTDIQSVLFVKGEDLSSQITISNLTFTVASAPYVAGSIEVFVDGVKQTRLTDYLEVNSSVAVKLTATLAAGYQDITCNYTRNDI